MSGERIATESSSGQTVQTIMTKGVRQNPDVSALASLSDRQLCVLAWHYHDDDVPGPDAAVEMDLNGMPPNLGNLTLTHYRIDGEHSNSFAAWQHLGSPQQPTPDQYAQLEKSGQLAELAAPEQISVINGKASLHFRLPRQAVSLLVARW